MNKLRPTIKHNIMALRHGHSLFNERQDRFFVRHPKLSYEQCQDHEEYRQILYDGALIDCSLSQKGIEQCKVIKNHIDLQQFQMVLVSPLQRTLQTAKILFQGRQNTSKLQVIAQLSETVRYACDITDISLQQKKSRYPKFNFQSMHQSRKHWYIDLLQQKQQNLFHNNYKTINNRLIKAQSQKQLILRMLRDKHLYQSDDNLWIRFKRLRKLLINYSEQYKKIAIISHYYILQAILKHQQYCKNTQNCYIENVKPYWTSVQQLLKE